MRNRVGSKEVNSVVSPGVPGPFFLVRLLEKKEIKATEGSSEGSPVVQMFRRDRPSKAKGGATVSALWAPPGRGLFRDEPRGPDVIV